MRNWGSVRMGWPGMPRGLGSAKVLRPLLLRRPSTPPPCLLVVTLKSELMDMERTHVMIRTMSSTSLLQEIGSESSICGAETT